MSNFWKAKAMSNPVYKVNFWYQRVIHSKIAVVNSVLIYIYMGVSVYWPLCVLFVFVCVYVRHQITALAKKYHVSNFSKLDILWHKTYNKVLLVPRLGMCRFIMSISKITHQMWLYHPARQRNKATKEQ